MTRDEAVAFIAKRLGRRTDLDADIVLELQLAQVQLEEDAELRPAWLLSEMSYTSTEADEMRIAVPADFLAEYENGALWLYDATAVADEQWTALVKKFLDDAISYYNGEDGPPEVYARAGDYFRVFPTPDDIYTLRMLYYKKQTELTTNVTNAWLTHAPDLIMGKAGVAMSGITQNKMSLALFQALEKNGRMQLLKKIVSDEVKGMELFMGGAS